MPTILLVDDNDKIRRSVRRFLERKEYDVEEAPNGQVAMARLDAGDIDIIISDVFMPNMNGFDFLMRIRDKHAGIPIIMMSGGGTLGSQSVLDAASKLGAAFVVEKPFEMREMMAAVEACVERLAEAASDTA